MAAVGRNGPAMLRITILPETQATRLQLEGRLAGAWVKELDRCWLTIAAGHHDVIVVDLSGMTFVDADGKMLLTRMWQQGAQLHAAGSLARGIVEEITSAGRSDSRHPSRNRGTEGH